MHGGSEKVAKLCVWLLITPRLVMNSNIDGTSIYESRTVLLASVFYSVVVYLILALIDAFSSSRKTK